MKIPLDNDSQIVHCDALEVPQLDSKGTTTHNKIFYKLFIVVTYIKPGIDKITNYISLIGLVFHVYNNSFLLTIIVLLLLLSLIVKCID